MNLRAIVKLHFGGIGSGCHGPNCGRRPGSLTELQQRIRQSPNAWQVEGPYGAAYGLEKHYVKDLGRGNGIARVIVHEAAPTSYRERGRPATYVEAQWQRRGAGKYESPARFQRESFLYDEQGRQVGRYLQRQYGIAGHEPFYEKTYSELAARPRYGG